MFGFTTADLQSGPLMVGIPSHADRRCSEFEAHGSAAGVAARLFQRSIAFETVGAVGPNAEHFLHTANLGSTSLFTQISEPPQKGQGSGCPENDMPRTASSVGA